MRRNLFLTFLLLAVISMTAQAQNEADRDSVRLAVLDYVEGVYDGDTSRIERSVHPEMAKIGYSRRRNEEQYQPGTKMTFAQLIDVTKTFNKDKWIPKDAPKDVVVYEVLDQTAVAKLTAVWGIDYMHLAKYDGKWKIVNVIWQSHPPKAK